MLKHADGDDTVEHLRDVPIILNAEFARGRLRRGAVLRDPHLFVGQIDADHRNLGVAREMEPQAAPSASDVEHPEAGLEQ